MYFPGEKDGRGQMAPERGKENGKVGAHSNLAGN